MYNISWTSYSKTSCRKQKHTHIKKLFHNIISTLCTYSLNANKTDIMWCGLQCHATQLATQFSHSVFHHMASWCVGQQWSYHVHSPSQDCCQVFRHAPTITGLHRTQGGTPTVKNRLLQQSSSHSSCQPTQLTAVHPSCSRIIYGACLHGHVTSPL